MKRNLILILGMFVLFISSIIIVASLKNNNVKIDKKIIDDLNQKYYDISFDLDKKEATIDGKKITLSKLLNISNREAKKLSKEDIAPYLNDTIGNINYDDNKIEITNPYVLKTLLVETNEEEILNDSKVESYDKITDDIYRVTYKSAYDTKESYEELKKDERIENVATDVLVEISDYLYPLDTLSSNYAWGVATTGLLNYTAKLNYQNSDISIKIAVLDTGVKTSHEVFKVSKGLNKIDRTDSYNYVDSNYDISDDQGHGTMVAGLVSEATSNNIKILPVKVLSDSGKGAFSYVLDAVDDLKGKVDIINLSLGVKVSEITDSFVEMSDIVFKEAYDAGTVVVCAAGNSGSNAIEYPASSDYTIAVSSIDRNKSISSFSNYGSKIDFAAPGNNQLLPTYSSNTSYDYNSGTSFATPLVSSALGLIKSENMAYSVEQLKDALKENVDDLGRRGKDNYYGYGSVNFNNHMFLNPTILSSEVSDTWSNEKNDIFLVALSGTDINRYAVTSTDEIPTDWNSIDSSTFVSIDTSVNENGIYYVCIKDKNNRTLSKEVEVKYIDKIYPDIIEPLTLSSVSSTMVDLSITTKDIDSGISKITWYYKKSSDSEYKKIVDNYDSLKSSISKTYQFSNLKDDIVYNVYVEVCDMVNNCVDSDKVEIKADKTITNDTTSEEDLDKDIKTIDVYGEWVSKNGNTYYYIDGVMQKGIIEIDGSKYFFGLSSGKLYHGCATNENKEIYYTNSKGIIQTGWQAINGSTYYFDENGMYKGILELNGEKYFLGENSGKLYTNGLVTADGHGVGTIKGAKYYTNNEGIIQTGWQTINGKMYYFNENGIMSIN